MREWLLKKLGVMKAAEKCKEEIAEGLKFLNTDREIRDCAILTAQRKVDKMIYDLCIDKNNKKRK